jgi:hypothetical protein
MKTMNKNWLLLTGIGASGLIIAATALTALSQTAPVLTITPMGTNQYAIFFTNNIGTSTYDLLGSPVLDSGSLWTWAAVGSPGKTNFVITSQYPNGFYRAILDTNTIPLWEAADPNNPATGILNVWIDSPANGTTLN